jgi:hypothetical protein
MKAAASCRMLIVSYQTTWPHVPEDCYTNIHCNENLRSHRQKVFEKRVLRRICRLGKEEVKATVQVIYSL